MLFSNKITKNKGDCCCFKRPSARHLYREPLFKIRAKSPKSGYKKLVKKPLEIYPKWLKFEGGKLKQ